MGLPFMLPWNDYGEAPSQGGSHAIKTNQEETSFEKASCEEEVCCQEVIRKEEASSKEEDCCQETRQQ
jgi:hypothetical protein